MAASPASPTTDTMRRVNELISASLATGGRAEPVAFFCECGDPDCHRVTPLSPAAYEQGRRDPAWLAVAPEHTALPNRIVAALLGRRGRATALGA